MTPATVDTDFSDWCVWTGDGPLIVMPKEALPYWEGSNEPSNGRVVEAVFRWDVEDSPATDYDRACDVGLEDGAEEIIRVGDSWGFVALYDEGSLLYFNADEKTVVILRQCSGSEGATTDDFLAEYESLSQERWRTISDQAVVRDGTLVAFHAANSGNDVLDDLGPEFDEFADLLMTEPVYWQLPVGVYTIQTAVYEAPSRANPDWRRLVYFCRLIRQDGGA